MGDRSNRTGYSMGFTHQALRNRWTWLSLSLLVAGSAAGASYPIVSGRTTPPLAHGVAAQQAIEAARGGQAGVWAAPELQEAEKQLRAARAELRRQEVRFVLFRDFRAAEAAFVLAEQKAIGARQQAATRLEAARTEARGAFEVAKEAVESSDLFGRAMHLGGSDQGVLQHARLALDEAQLLFDGGDYAASTARARSAQQYAMRVSERAADAASRYTDHGLLASWRKMTNETIGWSKRTGGRAIVVYKENHRLTLYERGRPVRTYSCDLGYRAVNDKLRSGDNATPEGRYKVLKKKTDSQYYLALLLDYPNAEDRARFEASKRQGRIPRSAGIGGLIEIHGDGGRGKDWTRGCVALANPEMLELFRRVEVGTPVTIVGSDGSGGVFTELVRTHAARNGGGK